MRSFVYLGSLAVCGLLVGGPVQAHTYDPDAFDPTGTTQRTVEYDPFHQRSAGTVASVSTGLQPLVGEYECEATSDFETDTIAAHTPQEILDEYGCQFTVPYVYPNEEGHCQVIGTDLTFTLSVERARACFPASCFKYDDAVQAHLPQVGCEYTAFWTSVLTEEERGLRVITDAVETLKYETVTWDADRKRVQAEMSGTLTGEVKRIDLDYTAVDDRRQANLENPTHDAHASGLGLITGWACSDLDLTVEIYGTYYDGDRMLSGVLARLPVPHGVARGDTEPICGDINNGFSALFNWNILPPETETVHVHLIQQGEIIDTHFVRVSAFEEEFLTGATGEYTLSDFPTSGRQVVIEWQEAQQNFVITAIR